MSYKTEDYITHKTMSYNTEDIYSPSPIFLKFDGCLSLYSNQHVYNRFGRAFYDKTPFHLTKAYTV